MGFKQYEYDGPPKLGFFNNSQIFGVMDIVYDEILCSKKSYEANLQFRLTTYYRVSQSYLPTKLPADMENKHPEAITEWWVEKYKAKVGPLHQYNWHRVILDGSFS